MQYFDTRHNINLHPPITNLTKFRKVNKDFQSPPSKHKVFIDSERFPVAVKRFLYSSSFCTLEEFLNYDRQQHVFCVCTLSLGETQT
jgi:hypothetical protein